MIDDGSFDLQLRLFAIFNFIFVAPGCINQMQPFFLHNRDLFETREKKVRYHGKGLPKASALTKSSIRSPKRITGLHSSALRPSPRFPTLSSVQLSTLGVGISLQDFLLLQVSRATFICR